MDSLDAFAQAKLADLDAQDLRRRLRPVERGQGAHLTRDGRALISFCCNDYLGLATDRRVKAAAKAAVDRYGAGAGASRLVTGDYPLMAALEAALAESKDKPAAMVFGSGYLANIGVIPALVGAGDLVAVDALAHACLFAGAQLSRAQVRVFRHNDTDHLAEVLAEHRGGARRAMVLTETVFSMDGDRAPLEAIASLAERWDAWLMADDAHGTGVVDSTVTGPLVMGTLSKALGAYGGYLCASQAVIELLRGRARSFVYTTGLPPAAAGAALEALTITRSEPERRARPLALARRFCDRLGLPPAQSAIVPVIVGEARAALALSDALEARGFLVAAIRPPTVAAGTARLRVTFSAAHAEADVDALAETICALAPGAAR